MVDFCFFFIDLHTCDADDYDDFGGWCAVSCMLVSFVFFKIYPGVIAL